MNVFDRIPAKAVLFQLLGILLAASTAGCAQTSAVEPGYDCKFVALNLMHFIRNDKDENSRGEMANFLAELYQKDHHCGASDEKLDELIALLGDRSDAVRYGAVGALAEFGPRAQKAVPALRKAMAEADAELDKWPYPVMPSVTNSEAIRFALRAITGEKIPEYSRK